MLLKCFISESLAPITFEDNNYNVIRCDLQLGHDLNDEKFVKKWFKKNHSDYLINCFAINDHVSETKRKNNLFNFPLETFSQYLQTNVTTLFSVCREFARNNKKSGIINFSSTYGLISPRPDMYDGSHKDIGYGVSKSAVINLSKYLAIHLAPNIRVNCIRPGQIMTPGATRGTINDPDGGHHVFESMFDLTQIIPGPGYPRDVANLVLFLMSDESRFITSEIINIDGGVAAKI